MSRDNIEGSEFESVGREVAKKCACLPIVIVTVARALKNKELYVWNDALRKLNIPNIHTRMELSFDYLAIEQRKTILLIGYANLTSVDELLMYGMGVGLFEDVNKMEERRNQVLTLVQQLKDSCLLLDSNTTGEDFSMHDVVREVAMSIASRDLQVFTKLPDELGRPDNNTVWHSIVLKDVKMGQLPQMLVCQQLKLLSISGEHSPSFLQLHDEFFTRMTNLEVLVLNIVDLRSLPPSLGCLTNLRALGLYYCQLDDIKIIGDLKKLEILSLKNSEINQLPVAVGHLTQLKLLDLRCRSNFRFITPDVISRLSQLEELYMGYFYNWEEEGLDMDRKNGSLDELKYFSNLTRLEILFNDAKSLPRDLSFKKLERYRIMIGDCEFWESEGEWILFRKSCRKFSLSLTNTNISLTDGHIMQLKGIEELYLAGLQDTKSILYGLDKDGFPQLKYLRVRDNENLLCIVDSTEHVARTAVFPILESLLIKNLINLEQICHQLTTDSSFSQLRKIKVEGCTKLANIFSFSVGSRLQLLQSIDVIDCENMEEIFATEREDESSSNISEVIDNIELCHLHSLRLIFLPQLKSLEYNSNGSNTLFSGKVALTNLEVLELEKINVDRIWLNQVAAMSCGIQNLSTLILRGCINLRYLFSSSMIRSFDRLQELTIINCPALEEIMVINNDDELREEEKKNKAAFPISDTNNSLTMTVEQCHKLKTLLSLNTYKKFLRLQSLSVKDCDSLEVIFDLEGPKFEDKNTQKIFSFEKLKEVNIYDCHKLKHVFPASVVGSLSQLETLKIIKCGVEEIVFVANDEANTNSRFVFPRVISLTLEDLPNFTTFILGRYTMELLALKELNIKNLSLQLESSNERQAQILVEKIFSNLETLSVGGKSIPMMWQFPEHLFYKIRYLEVEFDESTVISSLDFLQRFQTFKMLKICGYLPIAFTKREVEERTIALRCLNKCSNLKHIFKEKSNMDHLLHLQVKDYHIWVNLSPSSASFQNLITLKVYDCKGLTNLVTCSTAKSLGQLRKMSIWGCSMITEIVTADAGDEAKDYEIVFSELKELFLDDLQSLTSFCSANYTLKFPSLEELFVGRCPEMKSFSRGKLSTPRLQKVEYGRYWEFEECWMGDLNTTIQQLYKETEAQLSEEDSGQPSIQHLE